MQKMVAPLEGVVKILLAEDDAVLADLLRFLFKREHFQVLIATDGDAALREFRHEAPDIVILDLKMPKRSGIEVLKLIREQNDTPVIVLTATEDEDTKVKLFRMGADDYIVKPFQPRELLVRVEAQLRRTKSARASEVKTKRPLVCGEIRLDPMRHEVTVAGERVQLTRHEFRVLEQLMLNADTVMSVEEILVNVWGYSSDVSRDVVRVTIARLRRKIEADPAKPRYILAVAGEGYLCNGKP
jgi:DNA-binding response OmpR family regulator